MKLDPSVVWTILSLCATGLIAWAVYWDFRKKRLQFDERRIMIESGITPPPAAPTPLAGWPGVKQQELQLKYAERRLMIEKGLPVQDEAPKSLVRLDYLRRGIVSCCVGLGLLLGYVLLNYVRVDGRLEAQAWCLGLGPVALLFGIGNLIYQRFAPESHEPASINPEPGMQDHKAPGGPSGLV
jgi:hypothetical protein